MKKTILSMLALLALVFACKKDKDDNNGVSKEALIGKWEMKVQYRNIVDNSASKRDTTIMQAGLQSWEFLSNDKVVMHVRTVGGMVVPSHLARFNKNLYFSPFSLSGF